MEKKNVISEAIGNPYPDYVCGVPGILIRVLEKHMEIPEDDKRQFFLECEKEQDKFLEKLGTILNELENSTLNIDLSDIKKFETELRNATHLHHTKTMFEGKIITDNFFTLLDEIILKSP